MCVKLRPGVLYYACDLVDMFTQTNQQNPLRHARYTAHSVACLPGVLCSAPFSLVMRTVAPRADEVVRACVYDELAGATP